MLRQKSETQHQIPVISNPPSTYFHLYTHGLTYTNPHSDTLTVHTVARREFVGLTKQRMLLCSANFTLRGCAMVTSWFPLDNMSSFTQPT